MTTETNGRQRIKRAEKHVNEQLSYGGICPGIGPFGSTLEYRYQDGDLVDEIGQMRRLADALNSLAGALESEADLGIEFTQDQSTNPATLPNRTVVSTICPEHLEALDLLWFALGNIHELALIDPHRVLLIADAVHNLPDLIAGQDRGGDRYLATVMSNTKSAIEGRYQKAIQEGTDSGPFTLAKPNLLNALLKKLKNL